MGYQETWEVLLLPVGEIAGEGMASVTNKDPGPLSGLHDETGALRRTRTRQARTYPAGEAISRRASGAGSRSALIVPVKEGNRSYRDPLEGSGASHVQTH